MNRERIAWLCCLVLLSILALQVPGTMAQRDDDYAFVRTLVDTYRQVSTNYVEKVDEKDLQHAAISGMLATLDPHTIYIPPEDEKAFNDALDGSFEGVGIRLQQTDDARIEVTTPIDNSPAWDAGVLPGDIITKVDGQSIAGKKIDEASKLIKGPEGTEVTLTVERGKGVMLDLKMKRARFNPPVVMGYGRNEDNTWDYWVNKDAGIAYIRLAQFTPDIAQRISEICNQLMKEHLKGLILDLRFNPGGQLTEATELLDLFIEKGTLVTVKGRSRPEKTTPAKKEGTLPDFPMVVLVNEHSASASEVVSGALQDLHRATIVGTRSYGKGSVQEVIPLDGDHGELKLTVAYWYLPSGRRVQKGKDATEWGVEPSINVPMDEETEVKIIQQQSRQISKRDKSATRPTTQPVVDMQLQKAVEAVTALVELKEHPPTTRPATSPSTQP